MNIIENKGKNGVEVYFDKKPNYEIINKLKQNFFRWHTGKKCWYAKATQEALHLVELLKDNNTTAFLEHENAKRANAKQKSTSEALTLKTIRKATDAEVNEIVQQTWRNDNNMQEYEKNNYDFYTTQDGLFLEIKKASKISIEKTIYYNDEFEPPQINLENFIAYNTNRKVDQAEYLKNGNARFCFVKSLITVILDKYQDYEILDENGNLLKKDNYGREIIRQATNDEISDIITIYDKRKQDYITRLEKYYKRYGDHIHTYGYWANR